MGKRFGGLRIVPLILVLAVALSACSVSTETVATVGNDRITRGELNAVVSDYNARLAQSAAQSGTRPQTISAATILPDLITSKLIELAARDNRVQITPAELAAENDMIMQALASGGKQARDEQLTTLATSVAGELRPLVNAYGGAGIADATLIAVSREELDRLVLSVAARGTQMPIGMTTVSERTIKDEAIIFRNALAGRGVGVPAESLEPLVSILIEQINSGRYTASDPDYIQALFAQEGISTNTYQQVVRERVVQAKLKPLWAPAQVDAVVLQELRTDSQAKALEAIQKGRAGTPFADLLAAYQLPSVPPRANGNELPNSYVLATTPQLQTTFKTVAQGEYSEPLPTADNSQFLVYRIVRIEKRAPVEAELEPLYQAWVAGLRSKYPVTITDPALNVPVQ